jgi:hypothetical protein
MVKHTYHQCSKQRVNYEHYYGSGSPCEEIAKAF